MAKVIDIPKDNNIIKVPIDEAMPDNYLPYAVEVAKDRALPDVRDGLKPVHRRILYGTYMLKAFPDKPYYKSARIVGDILGKYHPHGDTSVYEAMVILAQSFTTRYPLIDGHGNWGSMDGDSAAAMRYTEARLKPLALEMLRDLDKDVVDFADNYSNSELEPVVLPARYPNLLVNGAFGIAVGLATNIPPHNLGEVIDATIALIEKPEMTTNDLMFYIKGPDLPTGGMIIGKNAMLSAYETGEGKVTFRAKTKIEKLDNGRLGIVIYEFPYRRNKARLLQTISEMTDDKKHAKVLESITDIRDESDRTGIRSVIELKKSADENIADKILKYLYKKTDLQCNISFNMVALCSGKPQTLGLKAILNHYIEHQKDVEKRKTIRELQIAETRFHIIEGFIKAIDIIDLIIETIRASKSKKDSLTNVMNRFGFTEIQAEAIIELMLYRLSGLEIKAFEKEYKELEKEIKNLKKVLENEKELMNVIKKELLLVKKNYSDDRRTLILENDDEAKIEFEDIMLIEDIMVTLSNEGYIKRMPLKSYNRLNTNVDDIDYREGDSNKFLFQSNTKDIIALFTNSGNMYHVRGVDIPELKWKDKGLRADEIVKGLSLLEEKIIGVFSFEDFKDKKAFLFLTNYGAIKKTMISKFDTSYSKIIALKLKAKEKLLNVQLVDLKKETDYILVRTMQKLDFSLKVPTLELTERNASSTQLFNLPLTDEVIEAEYTKEFNYRTFNVSIDCDGEITLQSNRKAINENKYSCLTNSSSKLLVFADNGLVYSIASFMIQKLADSSIHISKLTEGFILAKTKVLSIISVSDFSEAIDIYFFSKNGLVKKTSLNDFQGSYFSTIGYKLKNALDLLMSVSFKKENKIMDVLLITKMGMCIRFDSGTINLMGKKASGVNGIGLKDGDEIVFGELITEDDKSLTLMSNSKNIKTIELNELKSQNRAGHGNNLMSIEMDDYIKDVLLN